MKYTTLCLLTLITLPSAGQTKKEGEDASTLRGLLTAYFDGVAKKDLNKLNSVTTDDFVLFEGGRVWNNDSLINSMKKRPQVKLTFRFDSLDVRADHEIGRIIYFNYGDVFVNDTLKRSIRWIESATFRKVKGTWKMEFLHSTDRKK